MKIISASEARKATEKGLEEQLTGLISKFNHAVMTATMLGQNQVKVTGPAPLQGKFRSIISSSDPNEKGYIVQQVRWTVDHFHMDISW